MNARRDLRLVPVAGAAWAAAGVATVFEGAAAVAAAVCAVAAVSALTFAVRAGWAVRGGDPVRGRRAVALLAVVGVAFAAAGAVAVQVAVAGPSRDAVRAVETEGGRALTATARVVGKVERGAQGWRFDAHLERLRVGAAELATPVPVLVLTSDAPTGLDVGAVVELSGTAFPADPGDRAVLVVRAGEVAVRAPPAGPLAAASALRRGLVALTAELPGPGADLVPGLAVGDTSAVGEDLDAAMKATSLAHLTAVSGANCALVVGIAYGVAALCGARRGVRVAAGAVTLAGFVVLVTPEPSVVRAAAMALIAMVALLTGRPGGGIAALSTGVALLLVVDPWLASSLGFALSVAATSGLLLLAAPLADGLSRQLPRPVALGVAVPLAAQLACGPLLVLVQPTVPLHGVLANVLAGPAAPLATVLGLLACLTAGVPVLGASLAAAAWVPAAWIAGTAETLAELPGGTVPWADGALGAGALALVGLAVAVVLIGARRRWRMAATAVLCATAGVLLGAGPLTVAVERLRTPGDWRIAACDVGQGDAVLLRSAGSVALIDAGPDPAPLGACLDRFGVDRLDLLVLTHFDADHRGGVEAVVGRVDTVLHGPVPPDDGAVLGALSAAGARLVPVSEGTTGTLGADAWRVLWPAASVSLPGNDASVVLEIGGVELPRTLLLGDLSAEPQHAVAARLRGPIEVVKVAHHGSADQAASLYERAGASIALVTVGENDYGHPRREILDVLTRTGAVVLRTDTDGAVALSRAGEAWGVWRAGR